MNSPELVAFDLDGTLLNRQGRIRDDSLQAIDWLKQQGVKIWLVTGRHHTAARPYYSQLDLDTPVICCNGTYAYDFSTSSVIQANPLASSAALELLTFLRTVAGLHILVYLPEAMSYETENQHMRTLRTWCENFPADQRPHISRVENFEDSLNHVPYIWKMVLSHERTEVLRALTDTLSEEWNMSCEWSWKNRVDVTCRGNSKGRLLAEMLEQADISAENIVAMGDNLNDLSMLRLAGHSVAMANAEPEVRDAVDFVTLGNDEAGIAEAIQHYFPDYQK